MRCRDSVVLALILVVLIGCDTAKKDYAEVETFLTASEQTYQQSRDLEARAAVCSTAVARLNEYLVKHRDGEWSVVARASLENWNQRGQDAMNRSRELKSGLYAYLKQRAEEAAKPKHPLCYVESSELRERTESKEGASYCSTDKYLVKMRGSILGQNTYELEVTAGGCVDGLTGVQTLRGNIAIAE